MLEERERERESDRYPGGTPGERKPRNPGARGARGCLFYT